LYAASVKCKTLLYSDQLRTVPEIVLLFHAQEEQFFDPTVRSLILLPIILRINYSLQNS
jgi:hypothetical protein